MSNIQKQKKDIDHDLKLPRGETKVLQAEEEDYNRGLLVKLLEDGGYEVAYWYDELQVYPIEIIVDGESVKKDAKKVTFKFHPELEKGWITNPRGSLDTKNKRIQKDNGGGNGGGGGGAATSGSFGGGTVFTSQDTGVFTPTYGGRTERKKRWKKNRKSKKRTGIERLGLFLTDQSPERKMQKSHTSSTISLIKWVQEELQKDDIKFRQQSSSTAINDQTKVTDGLKNPVEFDAKPDDKAHLKQKDMEKKIKNLDDSENIKGNKPDEKGNAADVAPAGLSIQLGYGSGSEQSPTLTGGYRDQNVGKVDTEDEEDKQSPFV